MNTRPFQYEGERICQQISVKFVNPNFSQIIHRTVDSVDSHFLGFERGDKLIRLTYMSGSGMVLKTITYNSDHVLEVVCEESVCEIVKDKEEAGPS